MNNPTVIPAIDILGGRCVRLLKGDYDQATVYSEDPVETAAAFAGSGAKRLHVVDLDAARSSGDNRKVIKALLQKGGLEVQVAGGVRDEQGVNALVKAGAHRVVMGTAAVRNPGLLERVASRHPRQILAALDIRESVPAVSGWTETEPVLVGDLLHTWDGLPLAGVILTCIDRDGTMSGPDLETLAMVRRMTEHFLCYSGGVTSRDDIRRLGAAGAQAVILGKALYEGRLTLEQAMGHG
jgi:phosphoribosylformimino-5-aminoimidazole carboxamide ribotide isomerase